jgi:hypothetical protein
VWKTSLFLVQILPEICVRGQNFQNFTKTCGDSVDAVVSTLLAEINSCCFDLQLTPFNQPDDGAYNAVSVTALSFVNVGFLTLRDLLSRPWTK